jgi:hypothetical protein
MLKNFGYDGTYRDEKMSVSVMLENPLDYGLESTELVFSVTVKGKNGNSPQLEDFTFYVMDEANRLYNTQSTPRFKHSTEAAPEDDEPLIKPDGLITTKLNHEFLFQDLRIAFFYRPYGKIFVIELKH